MNTPPLPTTERPTGPPSRSGLIGELATVREPFRLAQRAGALRRAPRGAGRLVVDIPGWQTGPESLTPLRYYLRSKGHDAQQWGLGRNGSDVEATVERFELALERLVAERDGEPARLVGWSLGGVIARETARNRPDLVERIVTFGTPAQGGPSFTVGAASFPAAERERIAQLQEEANRDDPLTLPITAIYTRADSIVDWRACIDPYATDVTHIEATSTHVGLGLDPDVWQIIAEVLAD